MQRRNVLRALMCALELMHDEGTPDLACPNAQSDEYEDVFTLGATHNFLFERYAEQEEPEGELTECDWHDLCVAIDFLRCCRASEQWSVVEPALRESIEANFSGERFVYERLSLWDLLMNVFFHRHRRQQLGHAVGTFSNDPDGMTRLLVNGSFPSFELLSPLVRDAELFLTAGLRQLEASGDDDEEEAPAWLAGSYEFLDPMDLSAARECSERRERGFERETFQELLRELRAEWTDFSVQAYGQ